ncbi:3'-5' exonuclease [Devosia sp.]|uniref:3'-5' exonuclease n=1 Tax=Devosia sp. TaxID=1871048 RepID=UPI002AFF8E69|nr:3'-5' exonuclease [Devosia sp.]
MQRNDVYVGNLSIQDFGMFVSPDKALRLIAIHEAKRREFAAVAIVGVKEGSFPFYKAQTHEEVEADKHQFYVAVTRAERRPASAISSMRHAGPDRSLAPGLRGTRNPGPRRFPGH